MAKFELSVPYETSKLLAARHAELVLRPLWCFIAPAMIPLVLCVTAVNPAALEPLITFALLMLAFLAMIGGAILFAYVGRTELYLNEHGMRLPLLLSTRHRFCSFVDWSSVSEVDLEFGQTLRIRLNDGFLLRLELQRFLPEQVDQLLLALELWAKNSAVGSQLSDFKAKQLAGDGSAPTIGYTELWEQELRRRYSQTVFSPLKPGLTLRSGALSVVRPLAFGGWSAVYLARQKDGRLVVLKESVIPPTVSDAAREKAREHFQREGRLLIAASHPQIVAVFDQFVEAGRDYLLMDYVEGLTLRESVAASGAPPEATFWDWSMQIAGILDYLHALEPPIIHRDISPDNLIVRRDGKLTLVDFGAANEFVGQATGTLVGRQCYMAPEQLRGQPSVLSDWYAFGATLFFLATGLEPQPLTNSSVQAVCPTAADSLESLVERLTRLDLSQRRDGYESLQSLVKSCLAGSGAVL